MCRRSSVFSLQFLFRKGDYKWGQYYFADCHFRGIFHFFVFVTHTVELLVWCCFDIMRGYKLFLFRVEYGIQINVNWRAVVWNIVYFNVCVNRTFVSNPYVLWTYIFSRFQGLSVLTGGGVFSPSHQNALIRALISVERIIRRVGIIGVMMWFDRGFDGLGRVNWLLLDLDWSSLGVIANHHVLDAIVRLWTGNDWVRRRRRGVRCLNHMVVLVVVEVMIRMVMLGWVQRDGDGLVRARD